MKPSQATAKPRRPFHPHHRFAAVADIDPEWLRREGISALLLDVDDTIIPGDDRPIAPAALEWLARVQSAGIEVAILSNGTPRRVALLAERLGLRFFALSGKPFPWAFRRGLAALGSSPRSTAMIGDQLFTDILGARWAGVRAILVEPLTAGRHAHTRLIRRLERLALRR